MFKDLCVCVCANICISQGSPGKETEPIGYISVSISERACARTCVSAHTHTQVHTHTHTHTVLRIGLHNCKGWQV